MSDGKFSQPRPHRDEERQIEESFRQLTEDQHRRHKKVYTVEDDIRKTVQEISNQEVSVPDEPMRRPFEKSAKLEETVQVSSIPEYYREPAHRQPPVQPQRPVAPKSPYKTQVDDFDILLEEPVEEEIPPFYPEEEPDFIDKLMKLGAAFKKHQTPVILGLCGAALLLIVVFVSIFFAGSKAPEYEGIYPNVYIADIAVGGMSKAEAVSALKTATSGTYPSLDMVIDLSGTEIRLSPRNTKAALDVKAAVEAAYAYGRTGSAAQQEQAYQKALKEDHVIAALPYLQLDVDYIRRELNAYAEDTGSTLTQTSYGLEGNEPNLSASQVNPNAPAQTLVITMGTPGIGFDANEVYEKVLDAYSLHQFLVTVKNVQSVTEPDPIDLDKIYEEFYIEPVNASINLQTFEPVDGIYGYGFDLEKARELVAKAQPGEVLRIPMEYIPPEILDNQAFFQDTLGSYQTRGSGNEDRNKNLSLACGAIHGTVLNPGESMSFATHINRVSGFRLAPEDIGMEPVPQGGVSQVASTLYYAALMSDLNITFRSNHTYMPSFIEYGLDATSDLQILNTTGYPIRIDATYSGGYAKVDIFGTEERNYYLMLESSISTSTAPQTVFETYAYDNPEGYVDGDVIEEGRNGYLVKSYKVKYDRRTSSELSRDFIASSQYPVVDRVIAQVAAPPVTETPPEIIFPTDPPYVPPVELPTEPPQEPIIPPTFSYEGQAPVIETFPVTEIIPEG